ncbi:Uncharacterized protein TCM_014459 [Theobroma cacao]|uniref:Uncharacterized protein n=1 Tax=Theobroma cacao TaxID=3641 RepID=A0A061FYW5_THECC|nr:Uncharacterized protein TCM_014459 [Theobroma cacao]
MSFFLFFEENSNRFYKPKKIKITAKVGFLYIIMKASSLSCCSGRGCYFSSAACGLRQALRCCSPIWIWSMC